ncbi:cytochrome c peroxidase [uncultured Microscilla sp.]|uniref:cytochrome-c peroxidase n=1 Tax=uncultured Microscilla sp. TaxID=432653 RepID=UPI002606ACE0|nr:cytochrome c peroxidase [uncultured Microscilla sp.]
MSYKKCLALSLSFSIASFLFITINGCQNQTNLPPFKFPSHFPSPVYNFDKNPLSNQGVNLGRRLFFDPILSKDSSIACSNCHHALQAFADTGRFSQGIAQQLTKRNTPGLFNLLWQREFFADGGVRHFELIPLAPLVNRQEMQGDLQELLGRLNKNTSYKQQFSQVFDTDSLQSKHLLYALAQFMGSLISATSRYDQYVQKKLLLSDIEQQGLIAFKQKCSTCHQVNNQLFTDLSYRNIGLDSILGDVGRYNITERKEDKGKFKVPSLRNVLLTPPYMHDGRFKTIDEVLTHYTKGVKHTPTLDTGLRNNTGSLGIALSLDERQAIKAFLHTLTDTTFIRKHHK